MALRFQSFIPDWVYLIAYNIGYNVASLKSSTDDYILITINLTRLVISIFAHCIYKHMFISNPQEQKILEQMKHV